MKILMIGPGEPSRRNSGLGVACDHIAHELSNKIHLRLFSPETLEENAQHSSENKNTYKIHLGDKLGDHRELNADIVHVQIKSALTPYFYLSNTEQEITQEQDNHIQQALDEYTKALTIQGEKVDFDLIYAHDWMSIPAAIQLKKRFNKPLVLHIHALDYDRTGKKSNSWLYKLEKEGLNAANAIISVSHYHADIIIKNYGIDKNKIHVVHHGVNKKEIEKFVSPLKEPIILFAGRLCSQKGAMEFIETAKILHNKNEDVRFVMAGEGELFPALINKCMEEGMMDKFHFTGHLKQPELFSLMSGASVFVMPSASDPFGLSALEAANMGLPVVLSDKCGVKELLPNAEVVSKSDPKVYAQRIIKLLQNPEETRNSIKGNHEALKDKNWSNSVDKIIKIFENSI
ncbi:glycosyltransferase family 4 protein [Marivirga sp. S37H4]|uniref:Glycosyltransferase family 4 protein n=1 Tax=Marivirga aurantiaca TaxID=2802615 RepID=A0A934WVI1_9BACT|nr:glycosyltransferase family 4 protein [Marivirga aurantiaca]MBK6263804.1 glycosyltransferase family 4 protein [Marivirga aurantiaca]